MQLNNLAIIHTQKPIHTVKKQTLLIIVGCILSTVLMAEDTDSRQKLVGTWFFSATNTLYHQDTNTMTTVTQYHADGTFDMKGEIYITPPIYTNRMTVQIQRDGIWVPESEDYPFRRQIGGSGIWRIEQGYFYSTFTNSTGDWRIEAGKRTFIQTNTISLQTNVEETNEIILLTGQEFTKRDKLGRVQTATRKQ